MEPKRRQSSTCSEELFEFVDYTSVSNFERLSTAIAEVFAFWGTKDGDHGIFADNTQTTPTLDSSTPSTHERYSRSELLSIGDETFRLTYHYHPHATHWEPDASQPMAFADFRYLGSESSDDSSEGFHPLHRWTGFDRLFVLAPTQGSLKTRIFSQGRTAVELHHSKTLLSACALATQEVRCTVPVFVPVGQQRQAMYIGYHLRASDLDDELCGLEFRFNMSITYPVSSQCAWVDELYQLFSTKMDDVYEDCGVLAPAEERDCLVAGAFTYTCKNSFDENWKALDGWGNTAPSRQHPFLPFGSYNDPLRALSLKTVFPLAQQSIYLDNTVQSNMGLLTSEHWFLSCECAPQSQQRAFLSMLLDSLITSWIRDPANREYLPPYDASNQSDDARTDSGLVRNIFQAMGSGRRGIAQSGTTTPGSESDPMAQVLQAIFEEDSNYSSQTQNDYVNASPQLYSAGALGLRLQHGTSVPCKSFFWNFLLYALHALADPARMAATSPIDLLKNLWLQVLQRLRWHWEHSARIPNIDTSLYQQTGSDNEYSDVRGIDLRFNILHQKLTMINCCIERCIQDGIRKATSEPAPKRQHVSTLLDDLSAVHKSDQASSDNAFDKFHLLLEKFVDPKEEPENNDTDERSTARTESTPESRNADEEQDMSDSDMFFDPAEDFDEVETQTRSEARTTTPAMSDRPEELVSRSSSFADVGEAAHPHSMSESFVRLNYSSSVDSWNTRRAHTENTGASEDATTYEVKDPNISEGGKCQHPSLKLLETDEPMWIPETQDSGFMTEDMIKQQADIFESLGTSKDATHTRAKLQSAQLYSDMQAFKAANPHAILEDFVRWHSPKDWIEAENGRGNLSARMADPRNIWQELWKCSPRIPASQQKPLFDVSSEGEKALHYLETLSIHEVFAMLIPTAALIAYDTLVSHPVAHRINVVVQGMQGLGSAITAFPWHQLRIGKCSVASLISDIRKQELLMCNAISLCRKLPLQDSLINRLLTESETKIHQGSERDKVLDLFSNEKPSCREYILYSNCPGTRPDDRKLPMRQYALIRDNELRLVDMSATESS